eukprot:6492267-Prymnesium_polylepis.1
MPGHAAFVCLLSLLIVPTPAHAALASRAVRRGRGGGTARRSRTRTESRGDGSGSGPNAAEHDLNDVLTPLGRTVPVTYTCDARVVEDWLVQHNDGILGFDTETKPSFRRGEVHAPATLQLAGKGGACLVVNIAHCDPAETGWPSGLVDALADASTLKIGVAIDDDAIEIWQHFGYEINGRLDLGGVQAVAGSAQRQVGLRSLAASYLGVDLQKSNSIAKSNWERRPLSLRQLAYAALDSWVGREVFLVLSELAPATFAPAAARELVAAERTIADLYARRLMRRAVKEAALRVEDDLQAEIRYEKSMEAMELVNYGQLPSSRRLLSVQKQVVALRGKCARLLAADERVRVEVLVPSAAAAGVPLRDPDDTLGATDATCMELADSGNGADAQTVDGSGPQK